MKLHLADKAHADAEEECTWLVENRSEELAERWFRKLNAALEIVGRNPERFALANENGKAPLEIRQVSFGISFRATHRVVYTVRPDMVYVLRIRHLAQRDLTVEDL